MPRHSQRRALGPWLPLLGLLTLESCVHGHYERTPAEARGDFVVNALGATLQPCTLRPDLTSGAPQGTCLREGGVQCEGCVAVAPGTRVRILHLFRGDEQTDVTLEVGQGAARTVAHVSASGDWADVAPMLLPMLNRGTPGSHPASTAEPSPRATGAWSASFVDWGVYEPQQEGPEAAGLTAVSARRLIATTDRVEATLGHDFGFRYELHGPGAGTYATIRVRHPPLHDPASASPSTATEWEQWVPAGQVNWNAGWVFQHEWEMAPGEWTIQLLVDRAVLLEKTFQVSVGPR